jgi:hypothetical protein
MGAWVPFDASFAGPPKEHAAFKLDIEADFIEVTFFAPGPPFFCLEVGPSDFHEGLWRFDCGELWLCNPENGRYLELNLAPNGAFWSCVFALPRLRDGDIKSPLCLTRSITDMEGWFSTLTISRSEIERSLGTFDGLIGNVTLILGGCPDVDAPLENLHSAVPLGAVDFHRPQDWVPLSNLI